MTRRYRVHYRHFARYLSDSLPGDAMIADLRGNLALYFAHDPELLGWMLAAVEHLPAEMGWLDGLLPMCEVLRGMNQRFVPAIFSEWATDCI